MTIRVSDNYRALLMTRDLGRSLSTWLELQQRAGTMRRLGSFADDPRAVGSIQHYTDLIATNAQYLRNAARARTVVDATDTALQDVNGVLIEARELVLRESSALGTPDSMASAAGEVDQMIGRLLALLNTSVEGNYIFAGHAVTTPPFAREGDAVTYRGDRGDLVVQTGPSRTLVVNIPGDTFLGTPNALLAGDADLAPRLGIGTALDTINLGTGWQPGAIRIGDGSGAEYDVDLTGAHSIADVIAAVDSATGGAVTAAVSADGASLQFAGSGPLTVSEIGGGTTAASLGIDGSSQAGVLGGRDIRPALAATTALSDIAALGDQLPLGAIAVVTGGTSYDVDFSGAATAGDLVAIFNAAVPSLEMQLDAAGLTVNGATAEPFTITDVGSGTTARTLGIAGTGTPVRLFGVFTDLQAALTAGDQPRVRRALDELAALERLVGAQLVVVGGRQDDLDWVDSLLRQRDERLQASLAYERDADIATLSADLSRAEAGYQASLMVTSQLFEYNLMMFLS
jgi:flagellin-like hook-associated protein FlgL